MATTNCTPTPRLPSCLPPCSGFFPLQAPAAAAAGLGGWEPALTGSAGRAGPGAVPGIITNHLTECPAPSSLPAHFLWGLQAVETVERKQTLSVSHRLVGMAAAPGHYRYGWGSTCQSEGQNSVYLPFLPAPPPSSNKLHSSYESPVNCYLP